MLLKQGYGVGGLFIDYGQAAAEHEALAVRRIADQLSIPLMKTSITGLPPFGPGELAGRNAFFVFTALLATRGQPGLIAVGIHDGTPYYDCSTRFVDSIGTLVAEHTDGKTSVIAPFLRWSKKDVVEYFRSTGLPFEMTYSCEAGATPPCGRCASCRDREALGC
ncbi:7-cyano-7-deazaguanine synthase [uncultured Defluviicoccus sp.]|uniref:7-cyano-7-deazaguanine synthase n=1 Tax=metagenome TaxID=256318 RepID=A0A380T982_9ZZZZ|nr:7-cyano-7-deazaguanine synthase [uncultured Defluviicoccus sp.]